MTTEELDVYMNEILQHVTNNSPHAKLQGATFEERLAEFYTYDFSKIYENVQGGEEALKREVMKLVDQYE